MSIKKLLNQPAISQQITVACITAADALDSLEVPHTLMGGLALAAYGYTRATADVDFLVGDEAFDSHGLILMHRPGLPIAVGDVAIDYIPLQDGEDFLLEELQHDVVSAPALVYLKLRAGRRKDLYDVLELLEAGLDEKGVRQYLRQNAPQHLGKFNSLMEEL